MINKRIPKFWDLSLTLLKGFSVNLYLSIKFNDDDLTKPSGVLEIGF